MNNHRTIKQLHAFVSLVISTGLCLTTIFCFLIYGPEIEYHFFPVVERVKIAELPSIKKDSISIVITGEKIRSCRKIGYHALVKIGNEYFPSEMISHTYAIENETTLGLQNFGIWEIVPKGEIVKIEVSHQCHTFWETISPIGTWEK